jgi:hypothetical protein
MINNLYIKATPAGASITWGSITGTLSSQTDLQNALDAKFDEPTGTVSQYVRGDGSLANFPASTGGGGSLSYYLNGSVAQGTFGGVAMREMDRTPILGAGTDFTIATNGYIQSFITDANVPNLLEIPAGNWNFETYFSASSSGGTPSFYIELYKWNGTTLSLIASSSANPEGITNGTVTDLYVSAIAVPQTTLALTDRLAVRIYVNNSGRTIKLHTENGHLCQVITTFSTGLTALNGLTAQVQNFATGTTGTDFGISSATSTHTFNLPTASAANRGALSSADWTTFNNKQTALVSGTNIKTVNSTSLLGSGNLAVEPTITAGTTGQYYRGDKSFQTLDKTAVGLANVDNTSDANKPVSTATQTALNAKQGIITLTTTGTSGPSTLVGNTLNIPQYSGGGGGSQVGYRGFKYTVTEQFYGAEPNPTSGQAIIWFVDDGEGSVYYNGIYISRFDADGTDLYELGYKIINAPQQPYTLVNSAGVINIYAITGATFNGSTRMILYNSGGPSPNIGSSGSVCYFHFQTSNTAPAYTGYTIHGHLNSTPVPIGTFFIAPGSSTLGTTFTSRNCANVQTAGGFVYSWIQTESIMTGTMVVRTFLNNFGIGSTLTIASGSAAAVYNITSSSFVGPGSSNLSLRITQSGLTSCGILGFGFRAV